MRDDRVRAILDAHLDDMPKHALFPTVDRLNGELRDIVGRHRRVARLARVGTSRLGDPLLLASIGNGGRHVLVVGGPHPNEPVGFRTVLEAARMVASAPELTTGLDLTWHFVPCLDPDGARLNERWYTAPLTISAYHRHFFRPALAHQPEWAFPCASGGARFDAVLPETRSLMRVIDALRPDVLVSLHNSDFGGAHFVVSHPVPGLPEALAGAADRRGIPLETDNADTTGWPDVAPGVHLMPPIESLLIVDPRGDARALPHGACSIHYAARHRALAMFTEVPLWRVGVTESPRIGYAEALRRSAADMDAAVDVLDELLARVGPVDGRQPMVWAAVRDTMAIARTASRHWREISRQDHGRRPVTPAEWAGTRDYVRQLPLRAAGMLLRALRVEHAAGDRRPPRAELDRLEGHFDRWCHRMREETRAEPHPVERLVALQLESTLAAVLASRRSAGVA
ncbi:M14 family zinc carboxypeptidase [Allostreptomyces psammosilenae]|uniref:Peptidase M14 domain-containing protein n=1 Tax=Allostreptomyces psammosilenae TaxID=1892865 RepID=A0A852ZQP2_9ACTN|nr:M14 family zinc carboxypeptidase [Allostreptomyces psammosilenae]NYI04723.1 hypothetical protein [Allostreptomyces psammosilenae]